MREGWRTYNMARFERPGAATDDGKKKDARTRAPIHGEGRAAVRPALRKSEPPIRWTMDFSPDRLVRTPFLAARAQKGYSKLSLFIAGGFPPLQTFASATTRHAIQSPFIS